MKKINISIAVFFYRIEVQVISNPSSRLEKNHQILKLLLMTDFYDVFLKKLIFRIFRYFPKSSAAHTQIIVCVLSYVNMHMFDRTHRVEMSNAVPQIIKRTEQCKISMRNAWLKLKLLIVC